MSDTPKTDAEENRLRARITMDHEVWDLWREFARELERKNNALREALADEGSAHELWALAQPMPNEGAIDSIDRIHALLSALANNPVRREGA